MANRRELREQVYVRTGFDTQDSMITAPVVNAALNDALHFIEVGHDWPWLEASETLSTTAGTNYVTPGSTWTRTKALTISDGSLLTQIPMADFDARSSASSGQPGEYAIFAGKIYLYPNPDAVYSINHRFIQTESDLTTDDASPALPTSFLPALIELAASLILTRVRDEERANVARLRYQDWERVMTDNRRKYSAPTQVRVRPAGWI